MKKSTVVILVIILLVICGIAFYLYQVDVSKKQLEKELQTTEDIWKLQTENAELKEKLENQVANKSDVADNTQNKTDVKFDSSKMKSDSTNVRYEEETEWIPNSGGLKIEIKEGKPFLTTDIEDEQYKFYFSEVKEQVKNKEITGFKSKVNDVYYAYMGNGDPAPMILFLMEDGTVEFVDSLKMLTNEKYESQGKIKELSNIVKFIHLNAQEFDENGEGMGGWITVAAIDEDGYSFDLSASKTIQDNIQ